MQQHLSLSWLSKDHYSALYKSRAGSQYGASVTLCYDVMLKHWNRLDFYSSVASVMSEQLT